jgi:phosphoserine phosphatase RsbU/P
VFAEEQYMFKTFEEAQILATHISRRCLQACMVNMGLSELFFNAIEHGNLGISYSFKTLLKAEDRWMDEIRARLNSPEYRDKKVLVWVSYPTTTLMKVVVRDEGKGFPWASVLEELKEPIHVDAHSLHGRGLIVAHSGCFDTLEYHGKGNEVTCTIVLKELSDK